MRIPPRLRPWVAFAALCAVAPSSGAQQPVTSPAPPTKTAGALPTQIKAWTGDLDGMLERRQIRALVPFSKTLYYVVNGAQRGAAYDGMKAFEAYVNEKFPPKSKNLKVHVVFVPVSRGELLPDLVAGRGDIAIAALTITPERQKVVDFSNSTASGVSEIVVTGPSSPAIATVDDLSGKEVFVRKSSSYWGSLEALNARFQKEGKGPVRLRPAPEDLEDEDLLEMVNAGVVPIVVMDGWMPKAWGKVYSKIRARTDLVVASEGDFGWAMRKNSPKLMALVNDFVRTHRQGTTFGNTVIKKYTQNTAALQNSASAESRQRFEQIVRYFQKYSDQYHMDYLLMAAQGFQESRLDQNAKSHVGAIGVMQLMPATGKDMNVGDIHDTEANIHAGVKYIRFMVDQYYAKEPMDERNKVLFAFASYNAGAGRIQSLRKLAAQRGLDPNVWIGGVEVVAAEKIGMETVTYVANIYKYYIAYKLLTEQAAERARAKAEVGPEKK